jgi:Fur family ferric uptake transcriptional regulator
VKDGHATHIVAELRARGVRITSARRAVLTALVATDGHITAEDIAATVQATSPEVHLSTVYRTLESLESLGVIDHVHLGHGSAVYHLAENRHHHLVCESCKAVVHLPREVYDELARDLEERYQFALRQHHFALIGICARCRAAAG